MRSKFTQPRSNSIPALCLFSHHNYCFKVNVSYWPIPDNWSELGGTEEAIAPPPVSDDQCSYWFRLKYESRCARFTAVDYEREFFNEYDPDHIGECRLCKILNVRSLEEEPIPRDTIQLKMFWLEN